MKFLFNWKDGTHDEVEMSDCKSVEEAVNSRCGSSTDGLESCSVVEEAAQPAGEAAPDVEEHAEGEKP